MNHKSWKASLLLLGLLAACGPDDTGTTAKGKDMGTAVQDMSPVLMDMGQEEEDLSPMVDMPSPTDMPSPVDMPADLATPDMTPDMTPPVDMAPTSCVASSDCMAPQICVVDAMSGERLCKDPVGTKNTGEACSSGAECASNLCLNGACANPCQIAADCPNGYLCQQESVPLSGGGQVDLDVCVEAPQPCLSNSDCTAPELCVIERVGSTVTLTCQDPVPGGGQLGESCVADDDCLSNLCLSNVCSRPCQRPSDCSSDGSFICEPTQVISTAGQSSQVNVCKPRPATQCLSDSQCASPQRCVATRGASEVGFTCGTPNAGGADVGGSCNADADCAQNFCLGGQCAPPCQGNGDCSAARDFTCEVQNVTLANGSDSVQVCAPPVVCQDRSDCKISEQCYVRRNPSSLDTICRVGNVGGGSLGQVCNSDSECASNLCYEGRFGKVCSLPCDDNSDCSVTGYECKSTSVKGSGNTSVTAQICAPKTPPACTANDDCQTGTTCAIVPNVAGNALESVCIPSTGRLATGVACGANDDCASRVCLNGSCAAPCDDSNQCGPSQLCLNNTVSKSGLSGAFDVCERLQDQACSSTRSCTDGVRVCGDIRTVAQGVGAFCEFPNTSGAQLGATCATDADCREGVCLSTTKECSVVCQLDSDCSTAANQVCSSFNFTQTSHLDLCVKGCTDNASCGQGEVCTINSDVTNNDVDQICDAPAGAGLLGQACVNGGDCDTGLCLSTVLYTATSCTSNAQCNAALGESCRCPIDQPNCNSGKLCATSTDRCTRVCNDDGDCSGGSAGNQLTACSTDVNVTLPSGNGTKLLSMCGQPN